MRLRQNLVLKLAQDYAPDIICLQETKTPDEHFPFAPFIAAGYKHIHIHGMKSYNGLAILSKLPFERSDIYDRAGKKDCRHIAVTINAQGRSFDLHNLYIPAGGDEPDPDINDKFAHKLDFVDEMTRWFPSHYSANDNVVAVGDFNIAPHEHDVWSHKQLLKVVSHTPIEVEKLTRMQNALGWVDVSRKFVPDVEKCYSWWSYRNRDWKKSNRGRRLDHIWVTQPLKHALQNHEILKQARDWEKPSDHVPIIIELSDTAKS